ncbi:MAG: lycopene cyclase domain-containing protein [Salinibacter sp.]
MSYLTFHFVFLVPPILGLLLTLRWPKPPSSNGRVLLALPLICVIALTYTTPWDNYLVAQQVWWYGPARVIATIGYVPIEEYLFFLLQPLLTGLVLYQYLGRYGPTPRSSSSWAPWTGSTLFLALTFLGMVLFVDGRPETLYLALILIWAPPLLAGMWLYDGYTLWALRIPIGVSTLLSTVYLWMADAVAIRTAIWTIAPEYTIGLAPLGLPLEEMSFFLFTNLLVVHGILLLLYGSHKAVSPEFFARKT